MGRIGVSYGDVANVAKNLQENGKNPTVDAVREVLRTGSKSTIAPYLKQWRERQTNNQDNNDMPELSQSLMAMVRSLSQRIQTEVNIKIEIALKKAEDQISTLQAELLNTHNLNQILIKENHHLNQKLENAHKTNIESVEIQNLFNQFHHELKSLYQALTLKPKEAEIAE